MERQEMLSQAIPEIAGSSTQIDLLADGSVSAILEVVGLCL
jgi:hypothetical protein